MLHHDLEGLALHVQGLLANDLRSLPEVLKSASRCHFTEAAKSMLLEVSSDAYQALLIVSNGAD
jgi:hypothetical protein